MSFAQLLLVAAVICFVLAALAAFGVLGGLNVAGVGYLGLAFFAGAHLAP